MGEQTGPRILHYLWSYVLYSGAVRLIGGPVSCVLQIFCRTSDTLDIYILKSAIHCCHSSLRCEPTT
ncbi:hypothetical protein HDV57DRAFT_489430 [Trichoderma longibrachiatum]